jgi:hypothetical protein
MAILEDAVLQGAAQAREPEPPPYVAKPSAKSSAKSVPAHGKRLTLSELWERARRVGPPSKRESTALIRKLRDERYGS